MVCLLKKRITSDFLNIALFLTLLHGEFLYHNNQARNTLGRYLQSLNQYNGTIGGGENYGPTLSAPSFQHDFNNIRNFFDPPVNLITSKGFDDFQQQQEYISSQINNRTGSLEEEFDYHQILEEIQRLTTVPQPEPSADVVSGKGSPSFQDIIAYLISNTTNSALPSNLGSTVPNIPVASSSGGSGYNYGGFQPLSVISDNGRVEILSAVQPAPVDDPVSNDNEDIDVDNDEDGPPPLINISDDLDDLDSLIDEEEKASKKPVGEPYELFEPFEYIDSSFSFFDPPNNEEEKEVPSSAPNTEEEVGLGLDDDQLLGATALWPPPSPLLVDNEIGHRYQQNSTRSLQSDYELALGLAQQARALEFLENFQVYEDEELMSAISPLAIHRHSDDEGGSSPERLEDDEELGSVSKDEEDQPSSSKRFRGISTSSSVSSRRSSYRSTNSPSSSSTIAHHSLAASPSHDEPAINDHDDVDDALAQLNAASTTIASAVNSIIEEIYENDSGIFGQFLEEADTQTQEEAQLASDLELANLPEAIDDLALTEQLLKLGNEVSENEQSETDAGAVSDMIQTAQFHTNVRPTSHPAQPRGFQVHARMPGLLRGHTSMDQRWQELANILSLQNPHDPNGASLPPPLPHPFGAHHHHHLHHPSTLHHHHAAHAHAMHHAAAFSGAPPPTTPYSTESTRNVLLQNATLPPPELNSTGPYGNVTMGLPPNLGSAVASSMHLTNSSDPMSDPSSHYKMIESSDMLSYYPNTTNIEMSNQTTEGFLSSILNDDDLQLMDMAMNEGMYTMRMLDNSTNAHHGGHNISHEASISVGTGINATGPAGASAASEDRMEASSDSAVSSMGSERVPPLTDSHNMSDTEWSESEHHASPYGLDYQGSKIRGYDYYGKDRNGPPVAQKKHQMFGKRFQQDGLPHPYSLSHPNATDLPMPYPSASGLHPPGLEQPEMKYSCSIDFSRHHNDVRVGGTPGSGVVIQSNHTYALPPSHSETLSLTPRASRGPPKDKQPKMIKDFKSEEHLSRDEKKARSMGIPMNTDDVINLPMDEFNERLSKYDLTEAQLSLIRDIRRRGKNKVAAQNCRKRKLDQILQLADEVQRIRDRKTNLLREESSLTTRRNILRDKYAALYRHVFQALRDNDGNPYSTHEYTLQQAADGNIVLVPRNSTIPSTSYGSGDTHLDSHQSSRRGRSKDDMKKDGH